MALFKKKGPNMCEKGHVMNPEWDECLICRAGKTEQLGSGSKTVVESTTVEPAQEPVEQTPPGPAPSAPRPSAQAAVGGGKTKIVDTPLHETCAGELLGVGRRNQGMRFELKKGRNLIGSDPSCEVYLKDEYVSQQHASIRYEEGKFFLTDLDSSNGTFLNNSDEKLICKTEIKDRDVVTIVDLDFKLRTMD
jgi:hypothetical protein